jgi:hypothetical protein
MKTWMAMILMLAATLAALPPPAAGADAAPAKGAHAQEYTDAQLDQMLAPVALYPDQLLTHILMASTYPLEIVEADRWVRQPDNAALTGEALDKALQAQLWAPSVKSLVPFPQVLHMMDDNLTWTEQMGDAFLSDQKRTMDSVQRLRKQAKDAGNLASNDHQTVETKGSNIVIVPASPSVVYVPVYDPVYVYGPWPYPAYPPYYFPGYFGVRIAGGFGWFGFSIVAPLWGWSYWDWPAGYMVVAPVRYNRLNAGRPRFAGDRWRHDPYHRHGVPYPSPGLRERFAAPGSSGEMRRFRGYPLARPPVNSGAPERFGRGAPGTFRGEGGRPGARTQREPARRGGMESPRQFQRQQTERLRERQTQGFRSPPAFESFGRSAGEIRMQSERGFSSRHPQAGGGSFRRRDFNSGGGFGGRERERR